MQIVGPKKGEKRRKRRGSFFLFKEMGVILQRGNTAWYIHTYAYAYAYIIFTLLCALLGRFKNGRDKTGEMLTNGVTNGEAAQR